MLHATVPRSLAQCYIPTATTRECYVTPHSSGRNWDESVRHINAALKSVGRAARRQENQPRNEFRHLEYLEKVEASPGSARLTIESSMWELCMKTLPGMWDLRNLSSNKEASQYREGLWAAPICSDLVVNCAQINNV